jgi:L-ribulose-5-phosphate 4-epimerase
VIAERLQQNQLLIAALTMLVRAEIIDFNGHASLRCGDGRHMLINAGAAPRNALTLNDIVMVDFDGVPALGAAPPPMEFPIHAEIYRRRPDVNAIIHAHPLWSTVLGMAGHEIRKVTMQASVLGEIKMFSKIASINTLSQGRMLAETLADARVVMLQSHGSVCVGTDLIEAFALALYLEDTARRQYLALQLGPVIELTPLELAATAKNLWKPHLLEKLWDFHAAKL